MRIDRWVVVTSNEDKVLKTNGTILIRGLKFVGNEIRWIFTSKSEADKGAEVFMNSGFEFVRKEFI